MRVPPPSQMGQMATAAFAKYGRTSGTNPCTRTFASTLAIASISFGGLLPMMSMTASGCARLIAGHASLMNRSMPCRFEYWSSRPANTMLFGRREPCAGAKKSMSTPFDTTV